MGMGSEDGDEGIFGDECDPDFSSGPVGSMSWLFGDPVDFLGLRACLGAFLAEPDSLVWVSVGVGVREEGISRTRDEMTSQGGRFDDNEWRV